MIIKEINYGVACRIGNIIYINKSLRKYPKLRKRILTHELEHSSGYTKKDILMDIDNKQLKGFKKDYYSFILTHPSSWVEYLPCWFYEGRFVFSPTMFLFYAIICIFVGGLLKFIS